eukprot:13411337-Alexandrium_andersonii.AAC.1
MERMPRSPAQAHAGVRCAGGLVGKSDATGPLRDPAVLAYSWRGTLVRRLPPRGRRRTMCRRGRGGGRGPECPTPAMDELEHAGGCAALAALPA